MLTESGELVVTAVQRSGQSLERATLEVGDVVLLHGCWDALETRAAHSGVLAVSEPDRLRRHSVRLGARSYVAICVLVTMCVVLATGLLPPSIVVLTAAGFLVAARVITVAQAQRSIALATLVIVAGMIPLSTAMQTSGAADLLSQGLIGLLGESSPVLLLLGIVVIVLLLGQFISNLATVLVVAPVAMAVAHTAHLSPLPLLMGITIAGAASFMTPVATAGNLIVQAPGAYRFGDFWRLGLPCFLLFGPVAVLLVPLIWPF